MPLFAGHCGGATKPSDAGIASTVARKGLRSSRIAQKSAEAASAAVQRTFRGFLGRLEAEDKRIEMAEFIGQMRAREAQEEEEEYWRTHTLARWKRRVKNFFKRVDDNERGGEDVDEYDDIMSEDSAET